MLNVMYDECFKEALDVCFHHALPRVRRWEVR
jgi:hypothetical protein